MNTLLDPCLEEKVNIFVTFYKTAITTTCLCIQCIHIWILTAKKQRGTVRWVDCGRADLGSLGLLGLLGLMGVISDLLIRLSIISTSRCEFDLNLRIGNKGEKIKEENACNAHHHPLIIILILILISTYRWGRLEGPQNVTICGTKRV